jgi:quercetin dioxygenase-like cupin family protein
LREAAITKTNIPPAQVLALASLAEYGEGAVVSRTLISGEAGTLTVFAFDAGQGLSEHTSPYDALVEVLEGEGEFVIGGAPSRVAVGHAILMPANIPHAVRADQRFKMLLTMLRK